MEHTPLGQGRSWDGDPTSLDALLGVPRTEAFARLMEVQSPDTAAATRLLWETYDPQYWVWIPFALIDAAAGAALLVCGQMAKRWKDMNA